MPTKSDPATLRVMLDTGFWIDLRYDEEKRERFTQLVTNEEIKVLFSYGNFIDLVKREEQNELSEIIAETVDIYLPAMDYEGDDYRFTDDPIGLIPDDDAARFVRQQTRGLSDAETLKVVFRGGNWEPDADWYAEFTQTMKYVYDNYGMDYAKALAFEEDIDYEDGDEMARLWEHKVDVTEYIRKMASLYRIEQIKENEKIDSNDIADMEICSQAIVTDCDMLLIEGKWQNIQLVDKVSAQLTSEEDAEVFDSFEEFIQVIEVYLKRPSDD